MTRDEQSILKITETVDVMVHPWNTTSSDLISLSSGRIATPSQRHDLLNAGNIGESKVSKYMSDRLSSRDDSMFTALKASKLQTFSTQAKKITSAKAQQKAAQSDRSLFARLLVVSRIREVDLHELLAHSLSPFPPSLSTADGAGLSKCVKAKLLHAVEDRCKDVSGVPDIPADSALMVDCMALIQSLPKSSLPTTYGMLAQNILNRLLQLSKVYNARRVDLVGDRYLANSIKNAERSRRTSGKPTENILLYSETQKLPTQWAKFMGSGKNKTMLQSFLYSHIPKCVVSDHFTVYIGVADHCQKVTFSPQEPGLCELQSELACDHEEADTRLLFHAKHADSEGRGPSIIWSPDTDVAVLCLAHSCSFDRGLIFSTGTGNKRRMMNITSMAAELGSVLTSSLIGLHTISGCDTTSSFYGHGKASVLKLAAGDEDSCHLLKSLGDEWNITQELHESIAKFVCRLYAQPTANSLTDARYNLFCNKTSSEKSIPPTEPALHQHTLRANYQSRVWKLALEPYISAPEPFGRGWTKETDGISVQWFPDGHSAIPNTALQLVSCGCKKSHCQARCSCHSAKLPCTPLCSCIECSNETPEYEEMVMQDEETDDEDDYTY